MKVEWRVEANVFGWIHVSNHRTKSAALRRAKREAARVPSNTRVVEMRLVEVFPWNKD